MTSPVALSCAPDWTNIRSGVVSVTPTPVMLVSEPLRMNVVALPPATVQPTPPLRLPVRVRLPLTRLYASKLLRMAERVVRSSVLLVEVPTSTAKMSEPPPPSTVLPSEPP